MRALRHRTGQCGEQIFISIHQRVGWLRARGAHKTAQAARLVFSKTRIVLAPGNTQAACRARRAKWAGICPSDASYKVRFHEEAEMRIQAFQYCWYCLDLFCFLPIRAANKEDVTVERSNCKTNQPCPWDQWEKLE
ncbi:unnamed protein product [Protopolystoma xenopodis]|uniref:Uncharacterized protein n=1 Tax=Protopolystoma xenopodis TaxID=117903 RepID=A0A448WZK9_9PLAT|nr:unnamed protein product [Protopolystoma xenopodis]